MNKKIQYSNLHNCNKKEKFLTIEDHQKFINNEYLSPKN